MMDLLQQSTLFPYTTLFRSQGFVRIGADDLQRAHAVALAFFDGDSDIDGLAVAVPGDQRNAQPITFGVDRKSTRLNSSHVSTSYAVFCLKKKTITSTTVART